MVGVIADTHGLLRPEALRALEGSDLILHAGDVGSPDVLAVLEQIAPLFAVRGNVDRQTWATTLPPSRVVTAGPANLYLLHDIAELDLDPMAAELDAVIVGHSHQPKQYRRDGVLYFNPGSAGPRRFRLPVSVGRLHILPSTGLRGELLTLEV